MVNQYEHNREQKQALKNAYQNQVKQSKAVPPKYKYVLNGNDAGSIILETRFVSYYLSLPNKFFENIQSLVPVITGPLPEMRRIVEQYGIGISFRDTDDLRCTLSAGICRNRGGDEVSDFKTLYREADMLLYRAKDAGKNKYILG